MIRTIGREEVRRLAGQGTPVVDVLPAREFRQLHLPGAIHIPLRKVMTEAPRRLVAEQAVVVYFYDHQ